MNLQINDVQEFMDIVRDAKAFRVKLMASAKVRHMPEEFQKLCEKKLEVVKQFEDYAIQTLEESFHE